MIAFFDRLVETRGGLDELVRSSARLIGAPAGFASEAGVGGCAFDDRGRRVSTDPPQDVISLAVTTSSRRFGRVWIANSSDNVSLGELVIERMALSAATILERSPSSSRADETNDLTVVLSRDAPAELRTDAIRGLGFRAEWDVRVLVIAPTMSAAEADTSVREWAHFHHLQASQIHRDDQFLVALVRDVAQGTPLPPPPWSALTSIGCRAGIIDAHVSLATARRAIHLTSAVLGPTFVDCETLGALSHLADIHPAAAGSTHLVTRLTFLAQSESGRAELIALDAFCRHRSLRSASMELNLHHSSLAHRLKNAERKLNLDLAASDALFQLALSLQLYRIAGWS
ncbi:hypothetical protein ABIB15_002517 [Marisediminicola sp. UYEF4]|uniref:helix-turn-helix domain-containing protein n=1 Tax=Marisediminicola sp. UYEF4 TaxID=1756384 RepID=UPI0033941897